MTEARSDLWHVQMASGDVLVMTLDELDEAFNDGRIDESTMVLQGGALKWARLGAILGDEEPEIPAFDSPMETAGRQLVVPTPFVKPIVPTPAPTPTPFENDHLAPSVRPLAYDVLQDARPVGALESSLSLDDDFDPDMMSLRPSKKKYVFIGLAAAAALAIGGVGISKVAAQTTLDPQTATASIAQAAAAAAPAPVAQQPTTPTTTNVDALPGSRLSDDQKAALAKMDHKLEEQQAARAAAAAEKAAKRAAHHRGKFNPGKSGFHEGGDPHDPLNAKLNAKSKGW